MYRASSYIYVVKRCFVRLSRLTAKARYRIEWRSEVEDMEDMTILHINTYSLTNKEACGSQTRGSGKGGQFALNGSVEIRAMYMVVC